jgi:hypothetical protein
VAQSEPIDPAEKNVRSLTAQSKTLQWCEFNAQRAAQGLAQLRKVGSLSEFDQHQLYFTLRSVAKHNNKSTPPEAVKIVQKDIENSVVG